MSAVHPSAPPHGSAGGGYEQSDLRVKTIVIALVLVGALIVLGIVVSLWVFDLLSEPMARVPPPAFPTTTAKGPETDLKREPLLQLDPIKDLASMRTEESKTLTSYGWADREAGRARIPIQRAMALLLERGLPPTAEAASQKPAEAAAEKPAPPRARKAR